MSVRTVKLVAPRSFAIVTEEQPAPGPGEMLVRCDAVGICRSDLFYYEHGRIGESQLSFPFTLGHETAGTVVEHGAGVTGPPIGAQVAIEPGIHCGRCEWCLRGDPNLCAHMRFHGSPPVQGTHREYFTHPADLCVPLDSPLSIDDGVMLEPLAIGVHANRLVGVQPGDTVVVLGVGPVGMMCLAVASARGAGRIVAVDQLAYRLAIAVRYGAEPVTGKSPDFVISRIDEITGGRGADVVIEATSDPGAPGTAVRLAARGGRVGLVGVTNETEVPIPAHEARRKGLTLRWVRRSKLALHAAMSLATSGKVPLDGLVTHHFPLTDTKTGFDTVAAYRDEVFKAVIQPQA